MSKRIIFVGIHSKPGMQPLDSRTKTGKVIDAIIDNLSAHNCVKSNLFEVDRMPENDEMDSLTTGWACKYKPHEDNALLVLLGKKVQEHWPFTNPYIAVHHPAYPIRNNGTLRYIEETTQIIRESLKT